MAKQDLTQSAVARQNILNNNLALSSIEKHLDIHGLYMDGQRIYTRAQASEILGVDGRTILRYLENYKDEITQNGYRILKGKALKELKKLYVCDTDVVDMPIDSKVPSLGEIPFNRHFYIYQPPRDLAEIDAEFDTLSAEIMQLLQEVHS